MISTDIEAALIAGNPLTDRTAAELSLHGAEAELIERIVSIDVRLHPSRARGRSGHRWRLGLGLAAAAVVAGVVLALLPSGQRDGGPAPAFAASLVRFANASPLALLQLPGWHVVYANEESGGFGEMHFVRGPADAQGTPRGASFRDTASLADRISSLTWGPVNPAARNYIASGHDAAMTGLGVTARRLVPEGSSRGWLDIGAVFIDSGRELTFRATVTDLATFRTELRALRAVDTATWLRAMPPSVVKTADSSYAVRQMLKRIPLPAGFDAANIRGARLVHDRYQLGTAVTGTVACMWIADWNHARTAGDTAAVRRAISAMATAPRWPILHEMAREGAWPQELITDAKAMPSGRVKLDAGQPGRPLTLEANSGLGCSHEWGVPLGR